MLTKARPMVAALLALSMMAIGTAPIVAAKTDLSCPDDGFSVQDWLWGPNPAGETVLVSELTYRALEDQHYAEIGNGFDATIIDIGCSVEDMTNQERYCLRRIDPAQGDEAPVLSVDETDAGMDRMDDLAATFFDEDWDFIQTDNPSGTSDFCKSAIPSDARYIAVWSAEGVPHGVQLNDLDEYVLPGTTDNEGTLPGPHSMMFCIDVGFTPSDENCPPRMSS